MVATGSPFTASSISSVQLSAGMARHLARHRQPVLAEELQHLVVRAVRRLEVGEPKRLAVELEPMPQHVERALGVQFLHQRRRAAAPPALRACSVSHLGPELRLRVLR